MILNLQKQKSESAVSSNGQVFDDAYKQQFETMILGLKTQFDALTKWNNTIQFLQFYDDN